MRKVRCLLVLALGTMLVLGSFVNLNAENEYKVKAKKISGKILENTEPKIESANDALAIVIDLLKHIDKNDINDLYPKVSSAFSNTYLSDPKIYDEADPPNELANGWRAVLEKLWDYRHEHENPIYFEKWDVDLEYMEYDVDNKPIPEKDVDLKMTIKSKLKVGSSVIITGVLEHRRSCDPYP